MPELRVSASVKTRELCVDVTVGEGERVAVIGPNGVGKSSLIQLISGALAPDHGSVEWDGVELSSPRRSVPIHRRGFAYLEQRPLLFAHLNVLGNVAYGPRAQGRRRTAAERRAMAELDAVGVAGVANRRPGQLSGGQAQRVALARALAVDPELVLLDEPLTALDAAAAPGLRAVLRERLAGRTTVMVTHDLLDVLSLATRVVVLDAGAVVADGNPDEVFTSPPNQFVADFTGLNLLHGVAVDEVTLAMGQIRLTGMGELTAGRAGRAAIPPEAVGIYLAAPEGSPRNVMPARVAAVESRGRRAVVVLDVDGQRLRAEVTADAVADLGLCPGLPVYASVKAVQVRLFG